MTFLIKGKSFRRICGAGERFHDVFEQRAREQKVKPK